MTTHPAEAFGVGRDATVKTEGAPAFEISTQRMSALGFCDIKSLQVRKTAARVQISTQPSSIELPILIAPNYCKKENSFTAHRSKRRCQTAKMYMAVPDCGEDRL